MSLGGKEAALPSRAEGRTYNSAVGAESDKSSRSYATMGGVSGARSYTTMGAISGKTDVHDLTEGEQSAENVISQESQEMQPHADDDAITAVPRKMGRNTSNGEPDDERRYSSAHSQSGIQRLEMFFDSLKKTNPDGTPARLSTISSIPATPIRNSAVAPTPAAAHLESVPEGAPALGSRSPFDNQRNAQSSVAVALLPSQVEGAVFQFTSTDILTD